jgi:FAD/FMN-containing dehydrogenase
LGLGTDLDTVGGKLGGELSGDNGDGRLRQAAARGQYGDKKLGVYDQVKEIFDPKGVLNPGVIIGTDPADLLKLF